MTELGLYLGTVLVDAVSNPAMGVNIFVVAQCHGSVQIPVHFIHRNQLHGNEPDAAFGAFFKIADQTLTGCLVIIAVGRGHG